MSFPKLAPLRLDTANLAEFVPDTEHSLQRLVETLRTGSAEFAGMMEAGMEAIERVQAESIDGQGLMSSIFRIAIWLRDGRRFDAIFKITTTKKLETLKPSEIDALEKANGREGLEKVRPNQTMGIWGVVEVSGFRQILAKNYEFTFHF